MDGKKLPQSQSSTDPFDAGQMVGMLIMLTYIENNNGLSDAELQKIKNVTADKVQEYFNKPTEDILLMINNITREIKTK